MLDPVDVTQDGSYVGHSQHYNYHSHQGSPHHSQDDWAWWAMNVNMNMNMHLAMWHQQHALMLQQQQQQQDDFYGEEQQQVPRRRHEAQHLSQEWLAPLKVEALVPDDSLGLDLMGAADFEEKTVHKPLSPPPGLDLPPPGLQLVEDLLNEPEDGKWLDEDDVYGGAALLPGPAASAALHISSPLRVALPAPAAAPGLARTLSVSTEDPGLPDPGPVPTGMGVSVESLAGGEQSVVWTAHSKFLTTRDKSAVSPEFSLEIPGVGAQPFRIVLYPAASGAGKGAGSFKKAKGKGRIELKCEAQLPHASSTLWFGLGRGELQQATRGPVVHDFGDRNTCALPSGVEVWDFGVAVDATNLLAVSIRLASS